MGPRHTAVTALLCALCTMVALPSACCYDLHVPSAYASLGSAIADAEDGDSILIAPGVYSGAGWSDLEVTDLTFVSIIGTGGSAATVVSVNFDGSFIKFSHHDGVVANGRAFTLQGLTVVGAFQEDASGSGVLARDVDLVLSDLVFSIALATFNNDAVRQLQLPDLPPVGGGAIAVYNASKVQATGIVVTDSEATDSVGGGMLFYQCTNVTVEDSTFGVSGAAQGGAIAVLNSRGVTLRNIHMNDAYSTGAGAGLYFATVSDLRIDSVSCTGCESLRGAGMYMYHVTDAVVEDVVVKDSAPIVRGDPEFLYGGALYMVASSTTFNRVNVSGCTSVDGALYLLDDGAIPETSVFNDVNIIGNTAKVGGAVYCVRGAETLFRDFTFHDNHAAEGGAVYAQGGSACRFESGTMSGSSATLVGGAIQMTGTAVLSCTDCKVTTNTAPTGGGLALSGQSQFTGTRVQLTNNTAGLFGGAVYLSDTTDATLSLGTLSDNTAREGGGVFAAGEAVTHLLHSQVSRNVASRSGGALFSNAAAVMSVVDTAFTENVAQSGGAVFFDGTKQWNFDRSNFTGNQALASGGAFRIQTSSRVHITDSIFVSNTAGGDGGAIAAGLDCSTTVGSDGGLAERLAAVGDNLQLADVVLGVVRSHFFNNTAAGAGGAVTADLEHSMNFTECELAFNSAMRGAAVNVMSVIAGTFVKLHLHDNVASEEGGGLLMRGGFATCVDCVVERNTATEIGGGVYVGTPAHLDWQGGVVDANAAVSGGGVACVSTMTMHGAVISHNTATYGGGVYLHQRPQDCAVSAFSGLKLSNNTAARGGGGLFSSWQLSVPAASVAAVCVPNCTGCTHHNNAALYGPDVATPPAKLYFGPMQTHAVPPTMMFMAQTMVVDVYEQVATGPEVDILLSLIKTASDPKCKLFTHRNNHNASMSGMVSLAGLQLYAPTGAGCTLQVLPTPQLGGLPATLELSVSVVNCPAGYERLADGSCRLCPEDKYNINGDGTCRACDQYAVCSGGDDVKVVSNHWASTTAGELRVFDCPPSFCCPFATCNLDQMCADHRTGPLCGECDEGRTDVAGRCVVCSKTNLTMLFLLFIAGLVVMIVIVLAQWESRNPILTQVTFAAQTAAIIVPIDRAAESVNGVLGVFGVNLSSLLSALGSLSGSDDDGGLCLAPMTPVESAASLLALPVILFAALLLILLVHSTSLCGYNQYGRRFRGFHPLKVDWTRYRNAVFTLVMITYSTVGDAALKLIVCGDLLDNGELRLVAQPSVMCYEGSHWPWAIIAWLVVLLWVIGIPVFIFVFLRHKRRKNGRPLDENEHYRRGFGALFTPFSQRWYWFFAFNLMRRSVILGMSSLMFSQPIPRLFSLSCILAIFLAVHSWVQPFRDVRDNLGGLVILSALTLLAIDTLISVTAPPEATENLSSALAFVPFFQGMVAVVLVLWMVVALADFGIRTVREGAAEARARLVARPAKPRSLSLRNMGKPRDRKNGGTSVDNPLTAASSEGSDDSGRRVHRAGTASDLRVKRSRSGRRKDGARASFGSHGSGDLSKSPADSIHDW